MGYYDDLDEGLDVDYSDLSQARERYWAQDQTLARMNRKLAEREEWEATKASWGDQAVDVAKDVGRGMTELPAQIVGGSIDAVNNAVSGLWAVADMIEESIYGDDPTDDKPFAIPTTAPPESTTGGLFRGVSTFLTGFIPALRGVKLMTGGAAATRAGQVGQAAGAGAAADFSVMAPQEDNLAALLKEHTELEGPVLDFLATDPNDPQGVNRLRNVVEGLGLGVLTDGFVLGVRALRDMREAGGQVAAAEVRAAASEAGTELEIAGREGELLEPEPPLNPLNEPIPLGGTRDYSVDRQYTWDDLRKDEDVSKIIDAIDAADRQGIQEQAQGRVADKVIEEAADRAGLSVRDLTNMQPGQILDPVRLKSGLRLHDAALKRMRGLGEKVAGPNATIHDQLAFYDMAEITQSISRAIKGVKSQYGRGFRLMQQSAVGGRLSNEALDLALASRGSMFQRARAFNDIYDRAGETGASRYVRDNLHKRTFGQKWSTFFINGLLSNPATHMVNAMSNSLSVVLRTSEIWLAENYRQLIGGQGVTVGEAWSMAVGAMRSVPEATRLSFDTIKTGKSKFETHTNELDDAMASGQGMNARHGDEGAVISMSRRFADVVSAGVRVPSRLLMASDDYFKQINMRAELNRIAEARANEARARFGTEEAYARTYTQVMEKPSQAVLDEALRAAEYGTFTNQLGDLGRAFQKAATKHPYLRVIFPFIRTPINLLKFATERSPLAPIMEKTRTDLAAGGRARDVALAKMAMGSGFMLWAIDMTWSGRFTGQGPLESTERKMWMTRYQPYSIKFGDKWYSYQRFDPFSTLLGVGADIAYFSNRLEDEREFGELAAMSMVAFGGALMNKTYLSGLADLMGATSAVSPAAGVKKFEQWINRTIVGSTLPFSAGLGALARADNPQAADLGAADEWIERLEDYYRSRIPGMSKDNKPLRNLWGEPVLYEGGAAAQIFSPVYMHTERDDPATKVITDNHMDISHTRRSITTGGVTVDMNEDEADYYIRRAGNEGKYFGQGMGLHDYLNDMVQQDWFKQLTDGPDGLQAVAIKSAISNARKAARGETIAKFPDLAQRIVEAQQEQAQRLSGPSYIDEGAVVPSSLRTIMR